MLDQRLATVPADIPERDPGDLLNNAYAGDRKFRSVKSA